MKYFTIEELCKSDTAARLKIDNSPTPLIRQHLTELVDCALDPLRAMLGSPVSVTSGYRCPRLNAHPSVHGSSTSAHVFGYAADTRPSKVPMANWQRTVLEWAKTATFDQVIIEYPDAKNLASWIHIGIRNGSGLQRRQVLYTTDGKHYHPIAPGSKFHKV